MNNLHFAVSSDKVDDINELLKGEVIKDRIVGWQNGQPVIIKAKNKLENMWNKQEILVLMGPPASGKSSFAKKYVTEHPNYVIVSRDAIREARGCYWYNDKKVNDNQEDYVSDIELTAIESALKHGLSVIVDATNLNPKTQNKWRKIAEEAHVFIRFEELYIPFAEAVKRDMNEDRTHHVGKAVLKSFYQRYYKERYEAEQKKTVEHYRLLQNEEMPKAVICDLDGTIAWMQGRSPYSTTEVSNDKYDPQLKEVLMALYRGGIKLIFLSGREGTEQCRRDSEEWLKNLGFTDFQLLMRKEKDYRADEIIKKELFADSIIGEYNVIVVFDDRNKVVNMWRETGLLCCQVAEGDF